ncbi:hypothetical protein [Actinomadura rugatobispora]|uniref:Uncharacterized protein n=1 Tax=Actinomadura rugatobispora TaxID=1994 RepID=A0ABW1A0V6_9ACTN|nr:hypothetical protein GCM10010200_098280 [Actinomadura rugatobispora]
MRETFPGRAVRGVEVRYGSVGNCAPDFAWFSLDFEPLPEGRLGYEFAGGLDHGFDAYDRQVHEECAPAIERGVRLNLTGLPRPRSIVLSGAEPPAVPIDRLDGEAGGPLLAVRVVLTRVRYHPVDSAPPVHRYAGWRAAHKARRLLAGARPDPDPRDRVGPKP